MTVWLLSTCVLIAALILLRRVLRGRVDPRLTYALWLLAALRILFPGNLFPAPVSVDALADRSGLTAAVEQVRSGERDTERNTSGRNSVPESNGGVQAVNVSVPAQVPVRSASGPAEQTEPNGNDRFTPLFRVWGIGAALTAAWFLLVNVRFALRLRRGRQPFPAELPVPCSLRVYVVQDIPSPCLFGFFRPAVYLNRAAAENSRLDHILTHELAHSRHGDQWWAVVRCACIAVQWFNPLVWAAAWLSRQDCELACDAAAVKMLGETERLPYGRTLVEMITAARSPASVFQTATTMTGTAGSIQERITLLARKPKMTVLTLSCALLTAAAAAGCAFGGAAEHSAEEYLADNSQEQIFRDFVPATSIMTNNHPGFKDPVSIPADDLWGFFTLVGDDEMSSIYDDDNQRNVYRVSAATVQEVLDSYLDGCVLDPAQVSRADYDPETGLFYCSAYSYGSGRTDPAFYHARALSGDMVEVEFSDRYGNNKIVTGRITDDGVRYFSCVLTDYATYGADPLSDGAADEWRLDESAITADDLTALIAPLEQIFPPNHVPDSFIFTDPNELTEEQLFKAFLVLSKFEDRMQYWDEETRMFRFPEEFITQELHKYFKHFQFDVTVLPNYDPDTGCVVTGEDGGIGGDTHESHIYIPADSITVNGNVVNFTARFYTNYTMQVAAEAKRYAVEFYKYGVEFYDGGYYFLSADPIVPDSTIDYKTLMTELASDSGVKNARGMFHDLDGDGSVELILCYEWPEGPECHSHADVYTMRNDQAVRLVDHVTLGPLAESGAAGVHRASFQGRDWLCCWSVSPMDENGRKLYGLSSWELADGLPDPSKAPFCVALEMDASGEIVDAWGDTDQLSPDDYHEMIRCMVQQPDGILCRLDKSEGTSVGLTLDELLEAVPPITMKFT